MRMPPPPMAPEPPARRRLAPRVALVVAVVVLIVLIASARQLAVFYTDKLWFDDLGFGSTWSTLLVAHIVPALIFTAAMFVLMVVSLTVADRVAPRFRNMGPEDEIVERYRTFITPYAGRVRVLVAAVFALLVGVGASSQWKQWILWRNSVHWGVKDPQFHKDIGFYVFQLPFLRFIFQWLFVVLLVVLLVTAVFHYLNGGIRFQAPYQHVTPQVKAHLSVILALMAITKTAQYWLGRYELVFSHRGAVDGATYTDVKAELPALEFLALISIVAAVLFVVNIWQRGWTLPAIAVGLWAFISIVIGAAYPAYVQNFNVKPNELARESTYIGRNIEATRSAFDLKSVGTVRYAYTNKLTNDAVANTADQNTLANVRLWDGATLAGPVKALQEFATYYQMSNPSSDRYTIGDQKGKQVFVSARDLDLSGLPNDTWTNRHLVYTHGVAAVVAAASDSVADAPSYAVKDVPPTGSLSITQPAVYFGDGTGDYAIVDTKQAEVELKDAQGGRSSVHYQGTRGVKTSSFLRRAAFAMRFSDVNLLLSSQVTDSSRLLYVRDIRARVAKAAPFLRFDTDPYLVIQPDGHLEWVIDAYTVTDRYPYSQSVGSNDVDTGSGLGSGFNYVRNSVKATVDAYDGTVHFYVVDPTDPLVRSYRKAFPDLFTDSSKIPAALGPHFRYPEQLFKVQARQYELYHITKPEDFYNGTDQWSVAPKPSTGAVGAGSTTADTTPVAGENGGRSARLRSAADGVAPIYQTLQLPGDTSPGMVLSVPFVPVSRSGARDNNLTAFLIARNDGFVAGKPTDYGKLTAFDVSDSTPSPVAAARQIEQDPNISKQFSLLRQNGSTLVLGDVQMLPVGNSIIYARTVYVKTTDTNFPRLKYLAMADASKAVLGCVPQAVDGCTATSAVADGLSQLFGGTTPPPTGNTGGGGPSVSGTVKQQLQRISQYLAAYRSDTAAGDFAKAGQDLANAQKLIDQLTAAQSTTPGSTTPTTPGTTTTTVPGSSSTTTTTTATT